MTSSLLQHDALPYSGPGGFVHSAAATVSDALASGATPVVVADPGQLTELRRMLGGEAASVLTVDRSVTGRNPARVLPAVQHHIDASYPNEVHCICEPIRGADSVARISEARLGELVLQLPQYGSWKCRVTCLFDADLEPSVLAGIASCHEHAADPEDAFGRARADPLPPRPMASEELGVDRTTLGALRGFVGARAAKGGLGGERVDDLVYAVNEIVTNSICHGEGRARVSFWSEPSSVVCEVRDRGWIRDPLAGRIAPDADQVSGRGLWLVNQLCDLVQLRSSPAGTSVRLFVDI